MNIVEGYGNMKRTAVVTDSNAGILPGEAAEKHIFVLPMPFMIDG